MSNYNSKDEEYFDISEKILNLSDRLSEEIILTNIGNQLDNKITLFTDKINYLSLFKQKYSDIEPEDSDYDKQYIIQSLEKVTTLVSEKIHNRYGLRLGTDLDFTSPSDYLENMEAVYEFFFIRHFQNIIDYINLELKRTRPQIIERYSKLIQDETHSKDVFFAIKSKKFKNIEDAIIFHFIGEIIDDIISSNNSAYVLFEKIVSTDPYEEVNSMISGMLINYGEGLMFDSDTECYKLYMTPLQEHDIKNEVRNKILMKYLENCELEE